MQAVAELAFVFVLARYEENARVNLAAFITSLPMGEIIIHGIGVFEIKSFQHGCPLNHRKPKIPRKQPRNESRCKDSRRVRHGNHQPGR